MKDGKKKQNWTQIGKVRLNINENSTEDNKQPHFRGILPAQSNIKEGDEIYLAGWLNKDSKGEPSGLYFTLSMPEKDDSDIPF